MADTLNPLVGANAERSRSHNRQVVLGQVRRAGRAGRAEIARASGLSTQAVSNIIADLESDGLLLDCGRETSGRGLPAIRYGLNPAGGFAFGAEIRPGAILAVLVDLTGRTLFSDRWALDDSNPTRATARLVAMRDRAIADTGIPARRILGAGIVMPGPFGLTGLSQGATELHGWEGTDPVAWFDSALGVPVLVENDANAAAMAERISGVARDLDHFAYLYFGTGLGVGLVSGGQLVRGAFGNAGEIGHVAVPGPGGPVELELAVSRLSVERHLAAHGIVATDTAALDALLADGCAPLDDWIAMAAGPLGHAVAMLENLLDPQAIVLGGAMPESMLDRLIAAAPLSDRSVACRPDRATPRLQRGTSGRMTAALGGAALVLNDTFTPQITATP